MSQSVIMQWCKSWRCLNILEKFLKTILIYVLIKVFSQQKREIMLENNKSFLSLQDLKGKEIIVENMATFNGQKLPVGELLMIYEQLLESFLPHNSQFEDLSNVKTTL